MRPVNVLIFHAPAPSGAGPLVRALAEARAALAHVQRQAFLEAGADAVTLIEGEEGVPFGRRLADVVRDLEPRRAAGTGVVILGSGSVPLARPNDLRSFVEAAAGPPGHALANNRFSADITAVADAAVLAEAPDLAADNALPRWLEERAGIAVTDLRERWWLAIDLDTPADLAMLAEAGSLPPALEAVAPAADVASAALSDRIAAIRRVLCDRRAELVVAGRVSSTTLAALEAAAECRIRALVEERGLRASSPQAQASSAAAAIQRPPRSILGALLDARGLGALGEIVGALGEAAVIDSRVLLAHRLGADERAWPSPEDRFASDLLLPDRIADPWLRALTRAALDAPIPVLLGGHSLVNGDLRLLAASDRSAPRLP